jgi:hypothetical protein
MSRAYTFALSQIIEIPVFNVFDNYEQQYGYREVELKRLQEENFRLRKELDHAQTKIDED